MSLIQQNAPVSGKKAIDTGSPGAASVCPAGTTTYSASERSIARSSSGNWESRRFFRALYEYPFRVRATGGCHLRTRCVGTGMYMLDACPPRLVPATIVCIEKREPPQVYCGPADLQIDADK